MNVISGFPEVLPINQQNGTIYIVLDFVFIHDVKTFSTAEKIFIVAIFLKFYFIGL